MAQHPGMSKRQKEMARKEKNQAKEVRREQRKRDKEERDRNAVPGEDPDIAGIVPGPQPPSEDF